MYHYIVIVQFVLAVVVQFSSGIIQFVVAGVDCIEVQIVYRSPVRYRIERVRFHLILLVLLVVHR